MCKILAMGLENDPRLELLRPPPASPLTSVFRDGHAHFFAPLWRKRDVQEPINPARTCPQFSDTHSDTRSQPLRTSAPIPPTKTFFCHCPLFTSKKRNSVSIEEFFFSLSRHRFCSDTYFRLSCVDGRHVCLLLNLWGGRLIKVLN